MSDIDKLKYIFQKKCSDVEDMNPAVLSWQNCALTKNTIDLFCSKSSHETFASGKLPLVISKGEFPDIR